MGAEVPQAHGSYNGAGPIMGMGELPPAQPTQVGRWAPGNNNNDE